MNEEDIKKLFESEEAYDAFRREALRKRWARTYYEENHREIREQQAKYYKANKGKIKKRRRKLYRLNRESILEKRKKRYAETGR